MLKNFERFDQFVKSNEAFYNCYSFKILQILLHLIFSIVIGAIALSDPGDCSAPIPIFLQLLFTIYILFIGLNFCVGGARICKKYILTDTYAKKIRDISLAMDFCYFPLYWALSLFEAAWYIMGTVWIAEQSDCADQFTEGTNLALALIILWFIFNLIGGCCIVGAFCYVYYQNPQPPQQAPPMREFQQREQERPQEFGDQYGQDPYPPQNYDPYYDQQPNQQQPYGYEPEPYDPYAGNFGPEPEEYYPQYGDYQDPYDHPPIDPYGYQNEFYNR